MKEVGKINDYNGYYGTIINQNGDKYILLEKDIKDGEVLESSDLVTFTPEVYINHEVKEPVARFVKKIEKK